MKLNVKCIGIYGRAFSGKDTFADMLIGKVDDCEKLSFAEPIKKIMIDVFGFTYEQVYDPVKKQELDNFWNITPRALMQIIGTDMFREKFDQDVWIKLAKKKIECGDGKLRILPDVRFPNEATMIKECGGALIGISRNVIVENADYQKHASETQDLRCLCDYLIDNNGTLVDLEKMVNEIVTDLQNVA